MAESAATAYSALLSEKRRLSNNRTVERVAGRLAGRRAASAGGGRRKFFECVKFFISTL